MRLFPLLRFFGDRRAMTAITFALSMPVLVGAGGLGVEVGYWYFAERRLQTAADLAANAGAIALRAGADKGEVTEAATTEVGSTASPLPASRLARPRG